jgi:son of sevenless-like protein
MQAAGDVHEMYEKSLAVEPREREDEKIVRYVQLPTYGGFNLCEIPAMPASHKN